MFRTNWAGNYAYRAQRLHAPSTLEQLQEIAATAPRLRVLGSRHSFTGVADSAELVTLERMPAEITVEPERAVVSVTGNVSYGALAPVLSGAGVALPNLASLPHISVAGAVATATHGSGDHNGNLATSVRALELVLSDGSVRRIAHDDPSFDGVVVGLGAAGVVTRVTLAVEPAYEVWQRVFEGLSWDALFEHFDDVMASGYSVSAFHRWGEIVEQVWVKSRVPRPLPESMLGAPPAAAHRHPIIGLDPVNATAQMGIAGPWYDRLPHFRMGFVPSSGAEIQSEYLVARSSAVQAVKAVLELGDRIGSLVQVSELRTVAADRLWMSPSYGRETVGIHFTWVADQPAVERALASVEAALEPFDARPHWGKLFLAPAGASYERRSDFAAMLARFDPRGAFRNDWLERFVL